MDKEFSRQRGGEVPTRDNLWFFEITSDLRIDPNHGTSAASGCEMKRTPRTAHPCKPNFQPSLGVSDAGRRIRRAIRPVAHEEVYLRAYDTVSYARAPIGRYLAFYNGRRPHSSL